MQLDQRLRLSGPARPVQPPHPAGECGWLCGGRGSCGWDRWGGWAMHHRSRSCFGAFAFAHWSPPSDSNSPPPLRVQEHLSLEANSLCTLPPALTALPSLRYIDLSTNQLAWLPPGPWLRGLDTLLLSGNRLAQVPPVLASAAHCEVLDLSGNAGLELALHDVEATLARMPRLNLLLLGKAAADGGMPALGGGLEWRTPSVAALVALAQALPALQIDFEHSESGNAGPVAGQEKYLPARMAVPPPPLPSAASRHIHLTPSSSLPAAAKEYEGI